ncbi:MAG: lactate utilization protein [Rhodocyclales bacterium]|nr:lactate utilization protein [Rhodocyclales bacterium]
MSARDRILGRLRAAPKGSPVALPDISAWHAQRASLEGPEAIALFRKNIEAAHAEVHDTTAQDWPQLLARLAAAKGVRTLLFGPNTPHGAQLAASAPAGMQLVAYDRPVTQWRDELFDTIDASLTGARSAIADTGSMVLWPDANEPRLMSLVPPIHFVLLDAAQMHANLLAAMLAEHWASGMPTNALVISGPSKTADIQQVLAYGAHGPREVIVLLCHARGEQP